MSFGGKDIPTCNAIAESARKAAATLVTLNPENLSDRDLRLMQAQAQSCHQHWSAELVTAQQQFREFKIQRRQMNERTKANLASLEHAELHTVMAYLMDAVKMHEDIQEFEQTLRTGPLFWPPYIDAAQKAIEAIDAEMLKRRASTGSAAITMSVQLDAQTASSADAGTD